MKRIVFAAALFFAVQSVSAQVSVTTAPPADAAQAEKPIAGERIWTEFHAVEVEGPMKVRFEPADADHPMGISYYSKDYKGGKYVNKVENGVLKLRMQRQKWVTDSLLVTVRYGTLNSVKVSESDVRFVGPFEAHLLDLRISGGAHFDGVLDVDDLQLEVTGQTSVSISGQARYMDAKISTAVVNLSKLEVMAVTVDASNKANVTVNATDRVVMKSTTGATISYTGNPSIERSHTTSILTGSYKRLDVENPTPSRENR